MSKKIDRNEITYCGECSNFNMGTGMENDWCLFDREDIYVSDNSIPANCPLPDAPQWVKVPTEPGWWWELDISESGRKPYPVLVYRNILRKLIIDGMGGHRQFAPTAIYHGPITPPEPPE
jgi:hypothetical protein